MMRTLCLGLLLSGCAAPKVPVAIEPPPVAGAPRGVRPPEVVQRTLANGVPVLVVPTAGLPLVSVQLTLPIGPSLDPSGAEGLAALTTRMLSESAGGRSSIEQAAALDALAAHLSFGGGVETLVMRLDVHTDALADALPLAADALFRPTFADDDFARVSAQQLADIQGSLDNNAVVARLVASREWWGAEHPYGRPTQGTPASVRALSSDQVRAWHAEHVHLGGAALVVAGAIEPEQVTSLLDLHFGTVPVGERGADADGAGLRATSAGDKARSERSAGILLVDSPKSSQTVVLVTLPGRGLDDPHRVEIDALKTIIGGSFTSRLNRRLREELGYTYGARMTVARGGLGGTLSASAAVRADVTGDSIVELMNVLRSAQAAGVTVEEAERGRAQMITEIVDRMETRAGVAGLIASDVGEGVTVSDRARLLEQLDGVVAEGVSSAASSLALDDALIVLVGDREVVEASLKEAGLELTAVVAAPER